MSKRGVGIGDIHSGSIYSILPPAFTTYDGSTVVQNPANAYLWTCWDDFTWRVSRFDPDFIIVNGDMVEGPQKKSSGFEVQLPAQRDQIASCVETLTLLKKRAPRAKWYFTAGTSYHTGDWHDAEETIAMTMGGETYPSIGVGKHCREVLWLKTEGVVLEATHHPTGSATGFYRMTTLDRDGQWSAMAAKDPSKGIPKADVLIRSHLHFFGHVEHASKQIIQLPCWKLGDRHSRKSGLHRFLPDIGGVFLEVDGSAKERGESPCEIEKELYGLPPVKLTEL